MELEDKIRCNELLKEKHSNWLGLSNQKAIRSMLEELDRLQEENEVLSKTNADLSFLVYELQQKLDNSTSKDKIREKIELIKTLRQAFYNETNVITILQDLLKEE